MKKILQKTVLLALVFLSINASTKSKLSITTSIPTAIKVIIDGQKFYSQEMKLASTIFKLALTTLLFITLKMAETLTTISAMATMVIGKKL